MSTTIIRNYFCISSPGFNVQWINERKSHHDYWAYSNIVSNYWESKHDSPCHCVAIQEKLRLLNQVLQKPMCIWFPLLYFICKSSQSVCGICRLVSRSFWLLAIVPAVELPMPYPAWPSKLKNLLWPLCWVPIMFCFCSLRMLPFLWQMDLSKEVKDDAVQLCGSGE